MRQFRELVSALTSHAPAPSPRRKRKDETGKGFSMAANLILRPRETLPSAAYVAVTFLSDTLDWLNPWHHDAINDNLLDDEYHHQEQNDLSLHL